ncbi:MAG TPA: hypothetical protein VHK01_12645 [Lacipirellulaceae bacterium]|jgi:hypothetical protein|nr:hypothetical protein [Lacipirellulaceae bacterium]
MSAQDPANGQPAPIETDLQESERQQDPIRIRITWGGGQPSQWHGQISPDDGSFADLRIAELNADSSGSVWLENGSLHVASLSPHDVEGIEISVHGRKETKLLVDLSADPEAPPLRAQVALSDALRTGVLLKLDDRGNTLKVEAAPKNVLNLRTDGRPLIFFPGEQFSFELRPAFAEAVPGTTLDIKTTLTPAGNKEILWQADQRLAVPIDGPARMVLTVPLQQAEGVYEVRVVASRPSGFRKRFQLPGTSTLLAEERFQVVVLNSHRESDAQTAEWESVLEIDPTSPRWWDRLPTWTQFRGIPGLKPGPLGSIRAGAIEHPLGRFVELPAPPQGGECHWQAYSLPLEAVGVPHLLEIEYPADKEQHLGISIVEPNSAGLVEGFGRDSGCYVEGLGSTTRERTTHRVVFWPRTQAPLLLLTNQHPIVAAHFGHIRVLKRSGSQLASSASPVPTRDRWVAAYISQPHLADTFGASDKRPAASAFNAPFDASGDNWQTHYEAATRLADYLRYAGYNSAVLNVFGEGRSLYRSGQFLSESAEALIQSRQAAFEADGLELLLRVFDREQLALVPAVRFAAPLPELEKLRRGSDPQSSGLEWIGPDGRTWVETYGVLGGHAPYYNLLDPRVQQAMLGIVSELVDRYGHHPSLAGVAVQLSTHGYSQLPPLEWGLDDATVARFERDCRVQVASAGPNRFAARYGSIVREHAEAWRAWRSAQVTEFYRRMAELIRKDGAQRRLVLTTEDSLDHPQWFDRVRPNLLADNRVFGALRDAGIQPELREKVPGVVVCPTYFVGPTVPLRDRALDLEINAAFTAPNSTGNVTSASGALLYHRAQRHLLTSFAGKSEFRFTSESRLVSQPLAHGAAARKAYALALAEGDFAILLDGGELLPLGQEDVLRDMRSILQRLPTSAQVAQVEKQPVFLRTYSEPGAATLLVVNTSPWQAEARVVLNLPQAAAMEPLVNHIDGADALEPRMLSAGRQAWSLALEPYAVQAVRIPASGVAVVDLQTKVSDAAHTELANRIAELKERDTGLRLYPSAVNPGFEPMSGREALPGWTLLANPGTATAELDATAPRAGKTAVYFESRGQYAALESNRFPIPATGQFAMTVFLRRQAASAQAAVRMVIEADQPGRPYRRAVLVGGSQAPPYDLSEQWRNYPLLVNDLPLDSGGQMRIKLEMIAPGEVWMDEIITYDLLFPLTFYQWQQLEKLQLVKLIDGAKDFYDKGKITDCMRLLEGYWPRFLAAYTPPLRIANQPPGPAQEQLQTAPQPDEQPAPGPNQKWKWIIPKLR